MTAGQTQSRSRRVPGPDRFKGVRDITSGAVLLVGWAVGGLEPLGWALLAAAITPAADAIIVRTNGGKLAAALGIQGLTAALLVAAGLVLALS